MTVVLVVVVVVDEVDDRADDDEEGTENEAVHVVSLCVLRVGVRTALPRRSLRCRARRR